jgi:SAM-dependent methyltransferase
MTGPAPDFATRRFQTAAAHYLAGRAPYPRDLVLRAAELLDLSRQDRLLDLGCGPGQLAVAFSPLVGEVVAMDPEPAMLALARRRSEGLANVRVVAGGSGDLGSQLGTFRAALIGRAFHWMDRVETLRRFDGLIAADGAVVLFGDDRTGVPASDWSGAYRAIVARYAEGDEDRPRRADGPRGHIPALLESAFSRL